MYANELVPSWTGSENIWKEWFSIWYKIHQVKKGVQLQNIVHKSIFFFCKLKLYIYLAAIYHRSQAVLNSFYTVVPTTSLPYYTIVNSKYTFAQWDKNGKIYLYSAGGHSKKK